MKKFLSVLCAAALLTSLLSGCRADTGGKGETPAPTEQPAQSEMPADEAVPEAEGAPEEPEDGKALVVYYSASGHTEAVAEMIAGASNADIFELVPVNDYSEDDLNWRDDSSRVNAEHEDETLREVELVSTAVDSWDSYDTVFIGYPIWWGIAAWPVNGFVQANDFTGKTVIPFCTSSSSDLGESGELLAEMAGTGDWQEGHRFSSGASEAEVTDWVNVLNLSKG